MGRKSRKRSRSGVEAENPSDPVEDTTGAESSKRGRGKKSPGGLKVTKLPACSLPSNMTPTFYVGGGNGVSLVEAPLVGMGWKRITDKFDEKFRLKWVECKSRINYACFREGEQLVNHLPNSHLLTNKLGLLNSLKEYERVTLSTKGRLPRLRMSDFHPETYKLDEKSDRDLFLEIYKDEIWICKPVGMNQGKGIFLIRSRAEIMQLLEEREQKKQQAQKPGRPLMNRIVQRYILNPLLLDGRKFDVRAYMLVASTVPFLILYHKGYIRLSCLKYDQDDSNLGTHLTNQFVQKKDPNYKDLKEDTAWSMDKFNTYINEHVRPDCPVEIEEDWAYNTFTKQMQKIMIHCFNSVKHKLQSRIGFFDLFGLDFMIDQEMKVHLIEVNTNPAIHCNCEALKEVIPAMVEETLYVSIECFEKSRKNQQLMPLSTLKNFTILYCGTKPNTNIPRQSRSVSPAKENTSEKPRLVPTGSLKRPTSPPRTGQRNLTQCTPLYAAGPQRRMLDKEKSDSSPSMNLSSAKSSHVAPISAKTTTTSIGGVHSGRGKLPDTDRDRKVVPIVCKEASNVNKTSIGKEKSNVEKGDVKGSKGDVKNEREKDGVGSGEATGDKMEGDSKKESESDVNKTETKPKPNVVIMDTLSRTTDSLNQATTALGRLSVSLNQMGLADSLLEEVRLKMTHSESLKNAANASGLSAGTNTGTSTGINTVTTTGTNTDATADSPGASNAATAKTSSARSTTRERENLERGN